MLKTIKGQVWSLIICILLLKAVHTLRNESLKPLSRYHRSPSTVYTVDTLVVVDHEFVNRWYSKTGTDKNIEEYISLLAHEANVRLQSLDDHLSYTVAINIAGFRINQDILSSLHRGGEFIPVDDAVERFTTWLIMNLLAPKYDHAVLISGYKFKDESSKMVAGRAFVGSVCDTMGRSSSIVHDDGDLQGARTLAHELGHCLGSYHDGEKDNTCRKEDRYIMAENNEAPITEENKHNPWHFSKCSANEIDAVIKGLPNSNCLTQSKPPVTEFTAMYDVLPGQRYEMDIQCQMFKGKESKACIGGKFGDLADICTQMFCLDPDLTNVCAGYEAAEGTTCGNKKWCRAGRCIESSDAPELKDEPCRYGDGVITFNGKYNCAQMVQRSPSFCYNETFHDNCCESCGRARSQAKVCPWGDRKSGCKSDYCRRILPDGTDVMLDCCQTCDYFEARACNDVSLIDGVTCDVKTSQGTYQQCYNNTVAYHCCSTCEALRKNVKGCEYGDSYLHCKTDICSTKNKVACCQTCSPTSTAQHSCSVSVVLTSILLIIHLL